MKYISCALLALTVSACPLVAETLKISSYLPPKHTFTEAVAAWGKEVSAQTGGAVTFEVYPAGQLGPVNRQFDLVASGAADAAIILHSATPGRFPLSELAGLPLTHPQAGDSSAVASRRLTELAPQYLAGEHPKVHILWMAVTPPLKISLAKTDPETLAALKGQRIRFAGAVFQQVLDKLGAAPLPVQPADVSESLSKGIIDGAMFPYEALQAFDLGPELKYSMEPGIASATFAFVMNEKVYEALPPEVRKVVDATTGPEAAAAFGAKWDESETKGKAYLAAHEVKIVTLSDEEQKKFRDLVRPIIDAGIAETAKRNPDAQAFYDAYVK